MTGGAAIAVVEHGTDSAADRLAALFDAHHLRLYRLARRMCRDAESARDLVQDTFVRAARSPGSIPNGPQREEAWLVRILINLCRDRWRQAGTRRRLDTGGDALSVLSASDPEAALIARSVVWHALGALPPRTRAVLVMYELEGATFEGIAATLRVTRTTVRWHLSMGRRRLAKTIKGELS